MGLGPAASASPWCVIPSRSTTGLDLYGTPIDVWTTFATMRAQLLQIATDNTEGARGNVTDKLVTFRTRWLDGVTLENRVVYNGQTYWIKNIKEWAAASAWTSLASGLGHDGSLFGSSNRYTDCRRV
jgi:hypothetical protein